MAINKQKNKMLQITLPKKDLEQLDIVVETFKEEGLKVSKSEVILIALRGYIKHIVAYGLSLSEAQEAKESQGEKKDA